jgi:hypothetical protein
MNHWGRWASTWMRVGRTRWQAMGQGWTTPDKRWKMVLGESPTLGCPSRAPTKSCTGSGDGPAAQSQLIEIRLHSISCHALQWWWSKCLSSS